MDCFADIAALFCADKLCNTHINAAAQADKHAGKQCNKYDRRADRSERRSARKPADNGNVRHVEQHLQKLRGDQRNAEKEYLFRERAGCHIRTGGIVYVFFHFKIYA